MPDFRTFPGRKETRKSAGEQRAAWRQEFGGWGEVLASRGPC